MKRGLFTIVILLCLLALSACAETAELTQPTATQPEPSPPELRPIPALTPEESRQMATYLGANRALIREGQLFCYDFDGTWAPVLARYTIRDGGLEEFTVLARGCVPEYLCREGETLYYIDRGSGDIESVPASGGERKCLRAGPCDYLSLREGRLYFCDAEGRFCSLAPDGSGEKIVLDEPCAYPWLLGDAVLYRALNDGGRLHLRWLDDGTDRLLSLVSAYAPLIAEDRLWYSADDGLHNMGLDGLGETVYPLPASGWPAELLPREEGLLVRVLTEENGMGQALGPPEGPFAAPFRGYRLCDWLGGGWQVDTIYEPDGRIRCFLLTDARGREISFIAGRA